MLSNRWTIIFGHPWYWLIALVLLPVLWWLSYRSLAGLGPLRRPVALGLRSLLILLIVAALAEPKWVERSDRVTVIYVLDQSASIPAAKRRLMLEYVVREVRKHRKRREADRAGVVVFSRDAVVEVPPFDDDIPPLREFESILQRRDATNLADALKLASALFPEDSSKRIVLVSDGNENLGQVREVAPTLAANGIGIDVVPVRLASRAEVAVEHILMPQRLRKQQRVRARIVLNNEIDRRASQRPVKGRVRLMRILGGREEPVGQDIPVELPPGKTVIHVEQKLDASGIYTFKARFIPDDPRDDSLSQNNTATAFVHVHGKGRVLLIEDADFPGEFEFLVSRLRAANIEVDVRSTRELFGSLSELQVYDAVILANVPRTSGDAESSVVSFSDDQIQMLVNNTAQLGSGLLMIGGDRSFGAGGWANTELEKIMPVDFQIKNAKVDAVGALVMVMHASEMAQGNYWQKVISREALKTLGPLDYCGVLHWDDIGREAWLWRPGLARVGEKGRFMLNQLSRMTPGDMPDFEPSMRMALAAFQKNRASIKHMIIISDGDPSAPRTALVNRFAQQKIKITTVAIGAHGSVGTRTLQRIAQQTGGNYYRVTNPRALPRIFQREARRVTRPLVRDLPDVSPRLVYSHTVVSGIEGGFPPMKGMVLTTLKSNPLVEVVLRSPVPKDAQNNTILAVWRYNNGRVAAFTTDAGYKWTGAWTQWPHYDRFFTQLVRWIMRPVEEDEQFQVATTVRDGKVRVSITALDDDDQFANYMELLGAAVGPDQKPFSFKIRQVAPGRYEGEFPASRAGSYHVTIGGRGPGKPPLIVGANVPYSPEYRDRSTNEALLEELAELRPQGGAAGRVIGSDLTPAALTQLLEVDTFRRDLPRAVEMADVWPWFLFVGAVLFFADVFVRRVAIDADMVRPLWSWIAARLGTDRDARAGEHLDRLRQRKEAVARELDGRRAQARFEPDEAALAEPDDRGPPFESPAAGPPSPGRSAPPSTEPSVEQESYTDRLLKAKREARKRLEREDDTG